MARLGVIGLALLCIMLAFSHLPVGVDHVVRFTRPAKLKVKRLNDRPQRQPCDYGPRRNGHHCTRSFSNRQGVDR